MSRGRRVEHSVITSDNKNKRHFFGQISTRIIKRVELASALCWPSSILAKSVKSQFVYRLHCFFLAAFIISINWVFLKPDRTNKVEAFRNTDFYDP